MNALPTPAQLDRVNRAALKLGADAGRDAIIEYVTKDYLASNRYHATGHGVRDPRAAAVAAVDAVLNATDESLARAWATLDKFSADLGTRPRTRVIG